MLSSKSLPKKRGFPFAATLAMHESRPLPPIERQLAESWHPIRWAGMRVLVAVSGGADSVALLRGLLSLCTQNQGRLAVAHFNHALRGSASDADERFVTHLAKRLSLDIHLGRAAPGLAGPGADGLEAAARAARYQFLTETAERIGARYVVTGHTADDQAETILHHILRGTGLAGLAGMPSTRTLSPAVTLVRPLLSSSRADVLEYLDQLGQPYCQDASNSDASLTRNRLRHELLPLLARDYAPNIRLSLLRLGAVARDAQRLIDAETERLWERAVIEQGAQRIAFDCRTLSNAEVHLVRELFVTAWRRQDWPRQAMGWNEWNQLAELVCGQPRVAMLPGSVRAEKTGEQLVLTRG
jgi:tRNA(Ile)-lysidine synthase